MKVESVHPLEKTQQVRWLRSSIPQLLSSSKCATIGLTSGSRNLNESRSVYRLVNSIASLLDRGSEDSDLLLCRLEVQPKAWPRATQRAIEEPLKNIEKSVLGNWYQLDVSIECDRPTASHVLQQLPHALSKWQLRYKAVIMDLGPMHLPPSRILGRLCDVSFVMLGPNSCASAQWINQYIEYHEECGATIAGTIIASVA
jgi:hypothetical protein